MANDHPARGDRAALLEAALEMMETNMRAEITTAQECAL